MANWREHRPVDSTSAERKRRFRRRLYGDGYYGTEGEVAEIVVQTPKEIAALSRDGQMFWEGFEAGLKQAAERADP